MSRRIVIFKPNPAAAKQKASKDYELTQIMAERCNRSRPRQRQSRIVQSKLDYYDKASKRLRYSTSEASSSNTPSRSSSSSSCSSSASSAPSVGQKLNYILGNAKPDYKRKSTAGSRSSSTSSAPSVGQQLAYLGTKDDKRHNKRTAGKQFKSAVPALKSVAVQPATQPRQRSPSVELISIYHDDTLELFAQGSQKSAAKDSPPYEQLSQRCSSKKEWITQTPKRTSLKDIATTAGQEPKTPQRSSANGNAAATRAKTMAAKDYKPLNQAPRRSSSQDKAVARAKHTADKDYKPATQTPKRCISKDCEATVNKVNKCSSSKDYAAAIEKMAADMEDKLATQMPQRCSAKDYAATNEKTLANKENKLATPTLKRCSSKDNAAIHKKSTAAKEPKPLTQANKRCSSKDNAATHKQSTAAKEPKPLTQTPKRCSSKDNAAIHKTSTAAKEPKPLTQTPKRSSSKEHKNHAATHKKSTAAKEPKPLTQTPKRCSSKDHANKENKLPTQTPKRSSSKNNDATCKKTKADKNTKPATKSSKRSSSSPSRNAATTSKKRGGSIIKFKSSDIKQTEPRAVPITYVPAGATKPVIVGLTQNISSPESASMEMAMRETDKANGVPIQKLRLHVGGLSFRVTKNHLIEIFGTFGVLTHCDFPMDRYNLGFGRGFAFVEYAYAGDSQRARKQMNGGKIDNQRITVTEFSEGLLRAATRFQLKQGNSIIRSPRYKRSRSRISISPIRHRSVQRRVEYRRRDCSERRESRERNVRRLSRDRSVNYRKRSTTTDSSSSDEDESSVARARNRRYNRNNYENKRH